MKTCILFLLTTLITTFGFSETDSTLVKTKVNAVTVYPEGAQITREISISSKLGKSVLIFDDLPYEITQDNLQLGCNKLQHILSLKLEKVYGSSKEKSKDILDLDAQLDKIKLQAQQLKNGLKLLKLEQDLLSKNDKLNSMSTTIPLAELKQTVAYFNQKMEAIESKRFDIKLKQEALKKQTREINKQLQVLYNKRNTQNSRLIVTINNTTLEKTHYTLSYYHKHAGWLPNYNFRVDEIDKPLIADYNATVFQSTGENWKDIKLTLATVEPILNEPIKELEPWVLENKNATNNVAVKTKTPTYSMTYTGSSSSIRGTITDAGNGETVPMANVVVKNGSTVVQGTSTDFDGKYIISPLDPGTYNVEASFIGYSTKKISGVTVSPSTSTQLDVELSEEGTMIDEVMLVWEEPLIDPDKTGTVFTRENIESGTGGNLGGSFGRRSGGNRYIAAKPSKAPISSIIEGILNDLKHDISHPEFKIETPFTILSDKHKSDVRIKSIEVPTTYQYHIVPKIEQYAFLQAEIPDWNTYNFLSGNAKIYLKGKFIGQTYLDTDNFSDTLNLQLGKDLDIQVKRTYVQKQGNKTINGNKVKETIAYNIAVKNNKTTPIQLFVKDQIPITYRKDIIIELLEYNEANVNHKEGALTWDIYLKPSEKKDINFSYLAKYPKE